MPAANIQPDGQLISQWHIRKGATFVKDYVWKTGPDELTVVPVDLSGWTARAQVREKYDSATALLDITTTPGVHGVITLSALGEIVITVPASATTGITATTGVFDLELVDGAGFVKNFAGGAVVFYPEVTR